MDRRTRRRLLRGVAVSAVPSVAGCSTDSSSDPGSTIRESASPTGTADADRIAALEDRIDELERRNRKLEAALENESSETADLEAALAAERAEVRDLRSRLDEKDERIDDLERELERSENRIEELEDRIEEGEGEGEGDFSRDTLETARETAHVARESIVFVHIGGTGWVLDADEGYVVTNAHVVDSAETVGVTTYGGATLEAERVGYVPDQFPDVALLQCDLEGVPSLPTGDSTSLEVDEPVLQIGHPLGPGRWIVSLGRYRRRDRAFGLLSIIPSESGNSGSPLMTLDGSVVGLTTGGKNNDEVDYSRSDRVFTDYPDDATLTTSVPIETVLEEIDGWTR